MGGDAELAAQFEDGEFATLYLSPKDYHRIHMPGAARLRRMIYVPGELFSVNPATAQGVPGLFARNERVVCVFDVPHGTDGADAPVCAGAGGRDHCGQHGHGLARRGQPATLPPGAGMELRQTTSHRALAQGDEMGLFPAGLHRGAALAQRHHRLQPPLAWRAKAVRMGEAMGEAL